MTEKETNGVVSNLFSAGDEGSKDEGSMDEGSTTSDVDADTVQNQCDTLNKVMEARSTELKEKREKQEEEEKEAKKKVEGKVEREGEAGAEHAAEDAGEDVAKAGASAVAEDAGLGLLEAGTGPVGLLLAAIPMLMSVQQANTKAVKNIMKQNTHARMQAQQAADNMLSKVQDLALETNANKQQQMASDMLKSVSAPGSFAFSQLQGMGLQDQLQQWSQKFGPTDSAALQPYQSDEALVACKLHNIIVPLLFLFMFGHISQAIERFFSLL
jgi:hypothetical protein